MVKNKTLKYLLIIAGTLSFILGVLGVFLPLLPTTPFLLLASYCYYKSSVRLHKWLNNHRIFGQYIYNYMEYKAVKRKVKISAIIILWITLLISIILINIIYVKILLAIIGLAVTYHILSLKTLEKIIPPKSNTLHKEVSTDEQNSKP